MHNLEHSQLVKVNRFGFTHSSIVIDKCSNCKAEITENQTVVDFQGYLFCDQQCCVEAFCNSPISFGVEKVKA